MKPIKLAFLISAVAFVALQVFYYTQMPERVVTHFDLGGRPNGWMSRTTNLTFSCGLVVFLTSLFWFMPRLAKMMGPSALNIPKKEYWLAPENEVRLWTILDDFMSALGLAMNLFFIYLFHQLYRYNTGLADRVPMTGVIIFLAALAVIIVLWLKKLYDVPPTA